MEAWKGFFRSKAGQWHLNLLWKTRHQVLFLGKTRGFGSENSMKLTSGTLKNGPLGKQAHSLFGGLLYLPIFGCELLVSGRVCVALNGKVGGFFVKTTFWRVRFHMDDFRVLRGFHCFICDFCHLRRVFFHLNPGTLTSFYWKSRDIDFPGQRTWPMKVCNYKKLLSLWLEVNFLGDLLKVNFFIFPLTCFSLKCRINLGRNSLLNNRGPFGAHVAVSQREISNWKSGNIP